MGTTIDSGSISFGTQDEFPELDVPGMPTNATLYYNQTTRELCTLALDENGKSAWVTRSGGQLLVGPPGSSAPFTKIADAIAAAIVAGASPTKPITIRIQPGTYTENLVLTAGVYLVGLNDVLFTSPGDPTVIVSGAATVANVPGTIMLENLTLTHPTATPLTFGASAAVLLQIVNSKIINNSATAPTVAVTNSGIGSRIAFISSKTISQGAAPALDTSSGSASAYGRQAEISGKIFAGVGGIELLDCHTDDTLTTLAGGTAVINGGVFGSVASPNVLGNGTLQVLRAVQGFVDVGNLVVDQSSGQIVGKVEVVNHLDNKGAAPFVMTAADLQDVVTINTAKVVTLPPLSTVVEGVEVTFRSVLPVPGNVVLTAAGADNIDGLATYTLAQGESVRVLAQRLPATWIINGH